MPSPSSARSTPCFITRTSSFLFVLETALSLMHTSVCAPKLHEWTPYLTLEQMGNRRATGSIRVGSLVTQTGKCIAQEMIPCATQFLGTCSTTITTATMAQRDLVSRCITHKETQAAVVTTLVEAPTSLAWIAMRTSLHRWILSCKLRNSSGYLQ